VQIFAIISLILSIIRAIPEIVTAVQFIIALIKEGRKDKRKERLLRLKDLLHTAKMSHDYDSLKKRLEDLRTELEAEISRERN
jgi:hypothetical protein